MRKKIFILLCIGCLTCMAGCSPDSNNSSTGKELAREENGEIQEVMLTAEEEKVLCELYMDEERIRDGKLYDYQMECLNQIRYAKEYLAEKYPGDEFTITACNPKNKLNTLTEISFQLSADTEACYDLQIENVDGKYSGSDNYYGKLIQERYDLAVQEMIEKEMGTECAVYTVFRQLRGKETDGSLTVEQLFAAGKDLGRDTSIFFNEKQIELDGAVSKLQSIMNQNKLYGSYTVYAGEMLLSKAENGEKLKEYVKNQTTQEIKMQFFNCFELE